MTRALTAILLDLVWGVAIVAACAALLTHAMASHGYRASLYTVAPCAPAVQAAPHALSINPFASEAP